MIETKLKPEDLEKEVDKLRDSTASKILIQFLESKVDELDTLDGVKALQEVFGRQNAKKKLKEIINRLQPTGEKPVINEYN